MSPEDKKAIYDLAEELFEKVKFIEHMRGPEFKKALKDAADYADHLSFIARGRPES